MESLYHQESMQVDRAAFLFSMLKRRTRKLDDVTIAAPLPQPEVIANQPVTNAHFVNGDKKQHELYFAMPVNGGRVNGDATSYAISSSFDHESQDVHMANTEAHDVQTTLRQNTTITSDTTNNTTFKSSLLTGLELQTAQHRTRLLSDLLEGVKEGVMNAVDTEKEKIWFDKEKGRFWQFWRRGSGSSAAVPPDDGDENSSAAKDESANKPPPITENTNSQSSKFASRTITGLINALAQEVQNLQVVVDADPTTPVSNKTVHSIQIYFSRLGFPTLRMGGMNGTATVMGADEERITASEAFDRIDADNSGGLDSEELASALKMAAVMGNNKAGGYLDMRSKETISEIASRLVRLYDVNGDGVVDRAEYGVMVKDMAVLREMRLVEGDNGAQVPQEGGLEEKKRGWFGNWFGREENNTISMEEGMAVNGDSDIRPESVLDVTENEVFWSLVDQGEGSIVLEDMRLDLRRLLFGAIPVVKRVSIGNRIFGTVILLSLDLIALALFTCQLFFADTSWWPVNTQTIHSNRDCLLQQRRYYGLLPHRRRLTPPSRTSLIAPSPRNPRHFRWSSLLRPNVEAVRAECAAGRSAKVARCSV